MRDPIQWVRRRPTSRPVWSLPALLQKDNILPPHLGEVIGHRCAHDSPTTDDHLCLGRQGDRMRLGSWCTASGWGPVLPSLAGSLSLDHWQQPVKHHVCHKWEMFSHSAKEIPRIRTRQRNQTYFIPLSSVHRIHGKRTQQNTIVIHSANMSGPTESQALC